MAAPAAVSDQEVQEFREIFNLVDRDGGGTIDTTGAGEIEFEDFLRVMSKKVEVNYTPEQVIRSFEILSGNAPPGLIRPATLKQALTSFGNDRFSEEEAAEYVARLDTDKK